MGVYTDFEPMVKWTMFALAILLAMFFAPRDTGLIRGLKRRFRSLSTRPWLCAAVVFSVSISLNILLASIQTPLPWIHDEFSYLLGSDTFANGRLTNPTHPLSEHFESFHILSRPSFTSKYPPASAISMAAGQVLTGYPIVGLWVILALGCVATYWMLRVWTTPIWALWGGLLIALNGPILHAWGQSFWGGGMAFLGGALLYGGARRIINDAKTRDAILCGIGLVVLANSRPMEGLFVSLPMFAALLGWLFTSSRFSLKRKLACAVLPVVLIGVGGLLAMGKYNHAVTGDATKMPYQVHDKTYSASSMLIWKKPNEPEPFVHERMERFYFEFGRERQMKLRETGIFLNNVRLKFWLLWYFFLPGLGLSLLGYWSLRKDHWLLLGMLTLGGLLFVESLLASSWMFPHYLAPALPLFLALTVNSLRRMRTWNRNTTSKFLSGAVIVRVVLIFAILKFVPVLVHTMRPKRVHPRNLIERTLSKLPKDDLVIVSYSDEYPTTEEWVYNASDIDASPVVWARDMGTEQNAKLLEYFANRKVWRWHLEIDDTLILQERNPDGTLEPRFEF